MEEKYLVVEVSQGDQPVQTVRRVHQGKLEHYHQTDATFEY